MTKEEIFEERRKLFFIAEKVKSGYNCLDRENYNRFESWYMYFSKAAGLSQLGGMFYGKSTSTCREYQAC